MRENKAVVRHNAFLATINDENEWVRSEARELDLKNEMDVAWALASIMNHFQKSYNFAAISSNNIYWEMTDCPVRILYIPFKKSFITLINPKYLKLAGKSYDSTERCGSIPEKTFVVRRKSYVLLAGYDLDGEYMELEYGNKRGKVDENCDSWVIQHEMDHLDGVILEDKALFDNV